MKRLDTYRNEVGEAGEEEKGEEEEGEEERVSERTLSKTFAFKRSPESVERKFFTR